MKREEANRIEIIGRCTKELEKVNRERIAQRCDLGSEED